MPDLPSFSLEEIRELLCIRSAAREVRIAQRAYFQSRSREALVASKQAESRLDKLLTAGTEGA